MEIYFNLVDHVLFGIIITGRISVLLVIFWFNLQQRVVRLRQLKLIKVAKLLTLRLNLLTINSIKWKIGLGHYSLNESFSLIKTHLTIVTLELELEYRKIKYFLLNSSIFQHWSCPIGIYCKEKPGKMFSNFQHLTHRIWNFG